MTEQKPPNVKRSGAEDPEMTEERRKKLMESFIEQFRNPETAGIDWDLLRDGKLRAWPIPPFHR